MEYPALEQRGDGYGLVIPAPNQQNQVIENEGEAIG